ncbi:MAG: class I SAM-dependent methyltransferase [Sphingosinicella sp.]
MATTDASFTGSIPAIYDRYLLPLLFEPFADDLAARAAALAPKRILETAAGTGVVTAALAKALPDAAITATDLNGAMLAPAREKVDSGKVAFQDADAQALPFGKSEFDLVACQFGVMFFPDRAGAYREAKRVLREGGTFLFNCWNSLEHNAATRIVHETVAGLFPEDPPGFLQRVPFGYHDKRRIKADLVAAGYTDAEAVTLDKEGRGDSALGAAIGLCQGTPLRAEIEARGDLESVTHACADALAAFFGNGEFANPLSAHVVAAR